MDPPKTADELIALLGEFKPKSDLTLPQVLAIADDYEFACEIIQYVLRLEPQQLRPIERVVDLLVRCEYRMFGAGLLDFLAHPDRDAALDLLPMIDAAHLEPALRRGARLYDESPHHDMDAFETANKAALDAIWLEAGKNIEQIGERLRKWIAAHRTDFAAD